MIKTFVGLHNVEVFALPPCDAPRMYVLVPKWCVTWEPCRILLVTSQSIFMNYWGLLLRGFETEKAH